jgi:hypothetical protein
VPTAATSGGGQAFKAVCCRFADGNSNHSAEGITPISIHIDVLLKLQDRELRRQADRLDTDLKADFERMGRNAGEAQGMAHGDAYSRTLSPRLKRATDAMAEAVSAALLKETALSASRVKAAEIGKSLTRMEDTLAEKRRSATRDLDDEAKLTDKISKLRIVEANTLTQVARAHDSLTKSQITLGNRRSALGDLTPSLNDATAASSGLTSSLGGLGTTLGSLGKYGGPAVFAVIGEGLFSLGQFAASASQSVLLIPAAAAAAGAGVGALMLATNGFGQAIKDAGDPKKFTEDLRSLSPNAQEAARSIQAMTPAFTELKNATQDALFKGVGTQLNALVSQNLPAVQRLTTGVAGAFNGMFSALAQELGTPGVQQSITAFVNNVTSSFKNLVPAVAPLTQAFSNLIAVGSDFLPDIAQGAADAAKQFAAWIAEARKSGDLNKWLSDGLGTLKKIGDMAWDVGKAFMSLATPEGQAKLDSFASTLKSIADSFAAIVKTASVVGHIADIIGGDPMGGIKGLANDAGITTPTVVPGPTGSGQSASTPSLNSMLLPGYVTPSGGPALPTLAPSSPYGMASIPGLNAVLGASGAPLPKLPTWAPGATTGTGSASDRRDAIRASLNPSDYAVGGPAPSMSTAAPASNLYTGPHTSDTHGALVPNAANLEQIVRQMFPGVKTIGDYRAPDGYNEHSSGEALDIMVGGNKALGDQVNAFLLQNAKALGVQYDLWQQTQWNPDGSTSGMEDRGGATANHRDHVHARVEPGAPAGGQLTGGQSYAAPGYGGVDQEAVTRAGQDVQREAFDLQQSKMDLAVLEKDSLATEQELTNARQKVIEAGWDYQNAQADLLKAQQGTYGKLSNSAGSMSDGMQQIGAKLDSDFGVSKGLPGIVENATKALANLAFAPVIGALSGVTATYGTAGTGTGLLGMLAPRTNAYGQQMPNIFGQYAKDAGTPGYTPPGAGLPPGIAPSDTVPAMLTPGEVVVPKGTAQANAGLLQNMTGYALGGEVPEAGGNKGGPGGHGNPAPKPVAPAPGLPGGPPITAMAPPGAPGGIGGPGGPQGGPLPGPKPGGQDAGPTSTRDTAQRGITQGEGLPASSGIGFSGGIIGAAESAATSGAGMAGAGAAAQIGIDEINRAIGMGAQAAGIGVEGLMQTFLPVESELADPMRGWFGKGLGAVAGIRPAAKNTAGKLSDKALGTGPDKGQSPLTAQQVADNSSTQNNASTDNSVTNIDYHATPDASQDANFAAFSSHVQAQNTGPGSR